MRFGPLYDS